MARKWPSYASLTPFVGVDEPASDFELAAGQVPAPPADDVELVDREAAVESAAAPSPSEAEQPSGPPPCAVGAAAAPKSNRESASPRKPAQRKPSRQPISFAIPYRLLGGVAAAAALAAVMVGGYFAFFRTATPAPDYRQVATAYRQVYKELEQFRQDPRSRSPVGMTLQFSRSVAALRKQLENASPDSPAAKLGQAGFQLSETLNRFSAQPDSPEEAKFSENEQQFLKIVDDVAAKLATISPVRSLQPVEKVDSKALLAAWIPRFCVLAANRVRLFQQAASAGSS